MENNITSVSENTFQDTCLECNTSSKSQKGIKGLLQKSKSLSWKAWIVITVSVAILIGGGLFLYDQLTNTYVTPLDRYMDYMNSRSYSVDSEMAVFNGFAEAEFRFFELCNRLTDGYADSLEGEFEEDVKNRESKYGRNYQYRYVIEDKEKLDSGELNEFEDDLTSFASILQAIVELTYDFDSSDWEKFAESTDLSTAQARLYIGVMTNLYWELQQAEITEGYELTVNITVEGNELDEPEEHDKTMRVYKINGRWVDEELLQIHLSNRIIHWIPTDILTDIMYDIYYDIVP